MGGPASPRLRQSSRPTCSVTRLSGTRLLLLPLLGSGKAFRHSKTNRPRDIEHQSSLICLNLSNGSNLYVNDTVRCKVDIRFLTSFIRAGSLCLYLAIKGYLYLPPPLPLFYYFNY